MIKKLLLPIAIFIIAFLSFTSFLAKASDTSSQSRATQAFVTPIATQVEVADPHSIRIPSLGIEAQIEFVAKDTQGRMDVPKDPAGVGWWSLGTKPGENGSAVLAGHVDTATGSPGIFARIKELQKGDEILVEDTQNIVRVFRVTEVAMYKDSNFPTKLVFGNLDEKRLNLITCDGIFSKSENNYSDRLVVFSTLED